MQIIPFGLALLAGVPFAAAHFKIVNATGNMGGNCSALAVKSNDNQQIDVTKFKRKDDKKEGELFGITTDGKQKPIDLEKGLADLQVLNPQMKLPLITQGGTVSMYIKQLNGDGAGPINCTVSADATGTGVFSNTTMITDVPGKSGISNSNNMFFPLVIQMPDVPCTGTIGNLTNVCVLQCQNAIQFGGNVVIQQVGAAAAAADATGVDGGMAIGNSTLVTNSSMPSENTTVVTNSSTSLSGSMTNSTMTNSTATSENTTLEMGMGAEKGPAEMGSGMGERTNERRRLR